MQNMMSRFYTKSSKLPWYSKLPSDDTEAVPDEKARSRCAPLSSLVDRCILLSILCLLSVLVFVELEMRPVAFPSPQKGVPACESIMQPDLTGG
jgi:hypothetical protein